MTEPMRDRLLAACEPWESRVMSDGHRSVLSCSADEILARVLAVLADPDDETVQAVATELIMVWRHSGGASTGREDARAALAALVEHLRETP